MNVIKKTINKYPDLWNRIHCYYAEVYSQSYGVALSSFKTNAQILEGPIYTANRYYNSKRGIHISVPEI